MSCSRMKRASAKPTTVPGSSKPAGDEVADHRRDFAQDQRAAGEEQRQQDTAAATSGAEEVGTPAEAVIASGFVFVHCSNESQVREYHGCHADVTADRLATRALATVADSPATCVGSGVAQTDAAVDGFERHRAPPPFSLPSSRRRDLLAD